ncbi:anhydro-N-acetylmuramic acid kinase [Vicingus serpentipes]|uniref:Anhydro-N-acetylmuramic acid kinase n=1 Tax=Vicingus serpentipes TaxID=1926625 RepID=A0A5C6RSC8_9FLAO|nr:anhydro-N-acetylmuramic acid kinase [Vicingus serpentipes]TXB65231.1 anhydro-N-acetylmuramic acid kinase [Vicingus serpentipes]
MNTYNVIGVMSGTSLDGLDICYCSFSISKNKQWSYNINAASTINISDKLKTKLIKAINYSGLELSLLDNELGDFIGHSINIFIKKNNIKSIDFISSHGHTIFHQPQKKLTLQIGNGANISSITKYPVICDFRTSDLALKGNGAPLVPIGDKLLFNEYDYCLNLGGIANISYQEEKRIAYDICPANMVLNKLANDLGKEYDANGDIARSGKIDSSLLTKLNNLEYYQTPHPKSLGFEWVEKYIFPILNNYDIPVENKLSTFIEHIALQISNQVTEKSTLLITGGGVFNSFLIERLKKNSNLSIIIPPEEIINFKEALIFGFLGVLRYRNEINTLKSVTGAQFDNIGGCIYNALTN